MADSSKQAWIFLALHFWDKSPVTRLEILHSADAIALVEPTDDELEAALVSLTQKGLIEPVGDSFTLSSLGASLAKTVDAGPSHLDDTIKRLETYFDSTGAA